MREREREPDEPRLFDLPLDAPAEDETPEPAAEAASEAAPPEPEPAPPEAASPEPAPPEPAAPPAPSEPAPSELPLFAPAPPAPSGPRLVADDPPADDPPPSFAGEAHPVSGPVPVPSPAERGPRTAPFRARLLAALADLGVYVLVLVIGLLGAVLAGAAPSLAKAPAFALFLLSFSFLYGVVSLAFWGQTPGMAAAGVVARGGGDQPLTFGQTGLRWLAGVVTAALCGLPLLLALTGRSLADRFSSSRTLLAR